MKPSTSSGVHESPAPAPPTGAQAHYEAELAAGRFVLQHCSACARHVFYPRQVCPHCGGGASLRWTTPSGAGTVYSVTTVHIGPPVPVDVCLVDLDEGVRLMSKVRNRAVGELRIGQRVQAAVSAATPGQPAMLVFDAVADATGPAP